jgi:hypothetical protein
MAAACSTETIFLNLSVLRRFESPAPQGIASTISTAQGGDAFYAIIPGFA